MRKKACLIMLVYLVCMQSFAQTVDTTVINETRAAKTALTNGFPLPADVFKFQKELLLTPAQKVQLQQIIKTLALKTAEVSGSAIRNEHMLDSMFRTKRLNEGSVIFYTNRYGLYEGEYRGAVLLACYNTRKLLTAAQLNKLAQLQNHN